jgi:hypothetical protein
MGCFRDVGVDVQLAIEGIEKLRCQHSAITRMVVMSRSVGRWRHDRVEDDHLRLLAACKGLMIVGVQCVSRILDCILFKVAWAWFTAHGETARDVFASSLSFWSL